MVELRNNILVTQIINYFYYKNTIYSYLELEYLYVKW